MFRFWGHSLALPRQLWHGSVPVPLQKGQR